jgi:hypothetical protein
MAWPKKKGDPISDREKALNGEIAHLEAQIKKLDGQLQRNEAQPRFRSTAIPQGSVATLPITSDPVPKRHEPVFEPVDQERLKARNELASTPAHYNQLGVRKYDLPAFFRRLKGHFRGPSTTNPKLISYLAAGGIQGLRPLRYEKRVARNRFIALVIILFFTLLGLLTAFVKLR